MRTSNKTKRPEQQDPPAGGKAGAVTTARLSYLVLGFLVLLAGGCALHSPRSEDGRQAKEARLEKLLAEQQYQQALQFLPELNADLDAAAYAAEQQRLLTLINDLEKVTAGQAAELLARNEPAAALRIVEQALVKIPASAGLQDLKSNLRQEIEGRKNAAERALLISRVTYLASQLQGNRELALLREPSWFGNWRLEAMADALAAYRPALLNCGRQALAAAENEVAERCLQLARDIEASETVDQLLAQARIEIPEPEPAAVVEPIPEPLAEVKKARPAPPPGPSPAELASKLQEELARNDLRQGYATLAELEKAPGATELWRTYKTRLDQIRERLVAKYLEDAANQYRGGRIAQARETWLRVLELEPDNQTARDKIARADKVLRKLRDLQAEQQKMPPAQ
jgi:hypothetical protein